MTNPFRTIISFSIGKLKDEKYLSHFAEMDKLLGEKINENLKILNSISNLNSCTFLNSDTISFPSFFFSNKS